MTTPIKIAAGTSISAAPNPNKRILSNAVREMCGDVSDMTLWCWLNDPAMNFPRQIYIARHRYWKEQDVVAWLEAQASTVAA